MLFTLLRTAPEASKIMSLALLNGPDFLAYSCVALFKHLEASILKHHCMYDLLIQSLQGRLAPDFQVSRFLEDMTLMRKHHRGMMLSMLFS
jgi:hypothetical protein